MREPLHAIIAGRAEARIRAGEWAPGDRLPPERELCRDLGVSRATLRQALGELEQRGLVTRHQGRGTFVAPPRPQAEPALDREVARPAGRLRDLVILVTGSTGIAAAGARRFAAEGARVFVTSRTADHCARLVAEISDGGAQAAFAAADLSDESQVDEAVNSAIVRFGRLDGLFAVAGGSGRRFGDGPLHDVTLDGWRQTLDLNLTSQFLVARAVLRQLLGQDSTAAGTRGALLLVGSVLARHPVPELFATHAYAAAEASRGSRRLPVERGLGLRPGLCHEGAATLVARDEPSLLQLAECLAEGRPAHPEVAAEFALRRKPVARRPLARPDPGLGPAGDDRVERLAHRRGASLSRAAGADAVRG